MAGRWGAAAPRRIGLLLGATHPADRGVIDHLDIEGTRRRTIVRTGGMPDVDLGVLVHRSIATIKSGVSRAHLSVRHPQKHQASHALRAQISAAIGMDYLP